MEEKPERITGILVTETTNGMFDGPPYVFGKLETGEDVPLFQFHPDKLNYRFSEFIGLTPQEVVELKRLKDLIYFQEILP